MKEAPAPGAVQDQSIAVSTAPAGPEAPAVVVAVAPGTEVAPPLVTTPVLNRTSTVPVHEQQSITTASTINNSGMPEVETVVEGG